MTNIYIAKRHLLLQIRHKKRSKARRFKSRAIIVLAALIQ